MADDALGNWLAQRQRAALEQAGDAQVDDAHTRQFAPAGTQEGKLQTPQHDGPAASAGDGAAAGPRVDGSPADAASVHDPPVGDPTTGDSTIVDPTIVDPWAEVPSAGAEVPSAGGSSRLWANDERPRGRSRRLLLLAGIPWLLVLLLLVPIVRDASEGTERADARAGPAASATPSLEPADAVGAAVPGAAGGSDPTATQDQAEGATAAAAAAELAVRTGWTTASVPAPGARYVEDARTVSVRPAGTTLVVRVAALVLTGDDDGWLPPTTRLLDVVIAGSPPAVIGGPWPVATPPPPPAREAPERVEEVAQALAAAGFDVELATVAELEGTGLLRASVEGRGPDGESTERFDVMLIDADPVVVVGTQAAAATPRSTP